MNKLRILNPVSVVAPPPCGALKMFAPSSAHKGPGLRNINGIVRILAISGAMLLSHAAPGRPQAQHLLRVKVVNEFDRPLPGINFRIAFVGDYRSDPNGEREIMLPASKGPGQPIEFELKNDSLAIFEPARGRDKGPDRDAIILKLLRLGDHRLLNHEEMKALMDKLISEATKKEIQRLLAEKIKLEQHLASAPQDPLAEDAKRLGFSKKKLLAAIEKVKAQLQESQNPYDVGLAALYDKHYGIAVQVVEKPRPMRRLRSAISEWCSIISVSRTVAECIIKPR